MAARRDLERDLHDGAQQGVLAVLYELRLQAGRATDSALATALDAAADEAAAVLGELRELAHGIHPAILSEAGLRPALQSLASTAPVAVEPAAVPTARYPSPVELTVYRIVDEVVRNAADQAAAFRVGGAAVGHLRALGDLTDRVGMIGGSLALTSEPGDSWFSAKEQPGAPLGAPARC
jgi:signal transduction histidine kinase